MSKRSNTLIVQDMVEYAESAMAYVKNLTFEEFLHQPKTIHATIWCLTVLGEACRQIDAEFQAQAPDIPWHRIRGFRNRAIHEYVDVDLETVWKVTQTDLPQLLPQLKALLPDEGAEG